jgi:hypothetical protein
MSAIMLDALGPYDSFTGSVIASSILVLLLVGVIGDLCFAVRNRRMWITQSISDYFELWCRLHPLSASLLALLVGALVSHFFWSTGHPGPWPLPWP